MPYYSSTLTSWTPPTLAVMRGQPRWNNIKTDFTKSLLSQRVSYQDDIIEPLTLACNGLTPTEWATARNLYIACKGNLTPFKCIIDGVTTYMIIMAFDWEKPTPNSYNVNLTVEPVCSAEIIVDD
jgi:hypothetical protein